MMYTDFIVDENISIKSALDLINRLAIPRITLMAIDKQGKLTGVVAEGDIRRELLKGVSIESSIQSGLNKKFTFFTQGKNNHDELLKCQKLGIRFVPELNSSNEIVAIHDTTKLKGLLPVTAVLMAGGKGERLKPLTDNIPKPLLKVGHQPIIDYNIDNLLAFGVKDFHFILKHMHEMIEDHLNQKYSASSSNLNFVIEDEPRGTAGSLSCLKHLNSEYVVLMNSDLLTNINFADMFHRLKESNADFVMATTPYFVDIPYAIINLSDNEQITGLSEKPRMTYYSNAGIYMMKKEVLDAIPDSGKYDATDLVEDLLAKGKKVVSFPITGYWLDIGRPEEYMKAQNDIQFLKY